MRWDPVPEHIGWLQKFYLWRLNRQYSSLLKRQVRFPERCVISVGELTSGGAGKTPAIQFLAEHALHLKPLAILPGDGGFRRGFVRLVSDKGHWSGDVASHSDQALLLGRHKGLRVAEGTGHMNRAIEDFGADSKLVLMEDTFHYPLVHREHELVLVDATLNRKEMRLRPWGRLREPWSALQRADSVLLTRVDQADPEQLKEITRRVKEHVEEKRVFKSRHRVFAPAILSEIRNGKVLAGAFCSLNRPGAFFQELKAIGINNLKPKFAIDPQDPDYREFFGFGNMFSEKRKVFITTEKDLIRLRYGVDLEEKKLERLHAFRAELEILDGRKEEFLRQVLGSLSSS